MQFKYELKKIWVSLLISFVFCTVTCTSITYFLNNEIKLIKLVIDSIFYSLSLFHCFMYLIVKYSISTSYSSKNKYRNKVDFLFEQTGCVLFKNTEPKINYFFLKYTLISILACFIIFLFWVLFSQDLNTDHIKNDLSGFLIGMLFAQIAINTFSWYIIQPTLTQIIIKQLCYTLKKPIYDGSYLYLNNDKIIIVEENNKTSFYKENIFIYKNGKLHCERLPACISNVYIFKNKAYLNKSFLTLHKIKNMSEEELEEHYEYELKNNKRHWFIEGELFKNSENTNTDKEMREMIKLNKSITNF